MRFDREAWVKLYRQESPQHRLMSLGARSFRDFLLRFSSDDGTLLASSKDQARDICRIIGADSREVRSIRAWINELVGVGFLASGNDGSLVIVNFTIAQTARTPGAKRQAEYERRKRERELSVRSDTGESVRSDVSPDATHAVSADTVDDVRNYVTREEKRREEITPIPPDGGSVMMPCPGNLLPDSVAEHLAAHFGCEVSVIREEERKFKTYWTIGGGAGRRHSKGEWIRKCRDRICRRFEAGEVDARKPAGEEMTITP